MGANFPLVKRLGEGGRKKGLGGTYYEVSLLRGL